VLLEADVLSVVVYLSSVIVGCWLEGIGMLLACANCKSALAAKDLPKYNL